MKKTSVSFFLFTLLAASLAGAGQTTIDMEYRDVLKKCGTKGEIADRIEECQSRNSEIQLQGKTVSFGDEVSTLGWELVMYLDPSLFIRDLKLPTLIWSPWIETTMTYEAAEGRCSNFLAYYPDTKEICTKWKVPMPEQYAAALAHNLGKVTYLAATDKEPGWWATAPEGNDFATIVSATTGKLTKVKTTVGIDERPPKANLRCVCILPSPKQ